MVNEVRELVFAKRLSQICCHAADLAKSMKVTHSRIEDAVSAINLNLDTHEESRILQRTDCETRQLLSMQCI